MHIVKFWLSAVITAVLFGVGFDWILDATFYGGNIFLRIVEGTFASIIIYLICGKKMIKFSFTKTEP
jgi:hypothetical protein